jgi:uncharacterized protein DUF3810
VVEDAGVSAAGAEALRIGRALALLAAALAAAIVPTPSWAVERWYSAGAYLAFQPWVTAASNRIGVALIDLSIAVAAAAWILAAALDVSRRADLGWARVTGRILLRTITWASALYLAFLALWGLNYRREPLVEVVQYDAAAVTPDAVRALAAVAIDRANALHDRAHAAMDARESAAIPPSLAISFARLQRALGLPREARPGRPKTTVLDAYFRRAGVEGMTDPYFLETLVASDLLPFERPLIVAHEWAHLAGYANEGEANFLGWAICAGASEPDQYSGWLFLVGELLRAVPAASRPEFARRLAPGPTADRRAIADRIRRNLNPRLSAAGWRVYDRYLKANRVEAGAASYDEVVRLALGVRLSAEWLPLRK